jgi:hypothetical protein
MLNYSIYKRVNWANQYITNSYPSLCVTCTILSKCYHTLFGSVMLHYSKLMWIYSHNLSLNSIHDYAKHKIVTSTLYLERSLYAKSLDLAIQTLNPYLVSQALSHISLITEMLRKSKCYTNSFHCLSCLICCLGVVCLLV